MDTNLQFLLSYVELLDTHKISIIKSLENIQTKMFYIFKSLGSSSTINTASGRHRLSMVIMEVVLQYTNVKLILEKMIEKLDTDIPTLQRLQVMDTPCSLSRPESSTSSTNPFLMNIDLTENNTNMNPFRSVLQDIHESEMKKENVLELETPFAVEEPVIEEFDEFSSVSDTENNETSLNVEKYSTNNSDVTIVSTQFKDAMVFKDVSNTNDVQKPVATIKDKFHPDKLFDRHKEAMKELQLNLIEKKINFVPVENSKVKLPGSKLSSKKRKTSHQKSFVYYNLDEQDLNVNDSCWVVQIVNPSKFYVTTSINTRDMLHQSIQEDRREKAKLFVAARYKTKLKAQQNVGSFGYAYIKEKEGWYRVEIIDWLFDNSVGSDLEEMVLVHLVDFGEQFYCFYRYIHSLNQVYSDFPKMVTKCHIAHLIPPKNTNGWSTEATTMFQTLTQNKKFIICYKYLEGDSYGIEICLPENSSTKSIAEILIDNGLAQLDMDEKTEHIFSVFETCDNLNEAITGYDAKDEARICRFTQKNGRCYKGPRCRLQHTKLNADGFTTDKELILFGPYRKLPQCDEFIEILITEINDICNFYGHIIEEPMDSEPYNLGFYNLKKAMNTASMVTTYVPYKVFPTPGELVIVEDEKVYLRALYLEDVDFCNAIVYLVDYGKEIVVDLRKILYIKEDFSYVPYQAFKFKIKACCQKKDCNKTELNDFIQNSMIMKKFSAQVKYDEEPILIDLYDSKNMKMSFVFDRMNFIEMLE